MPQSSDVLDRWIASSFFVHGHTPRKSGTLVLYMGSTSTPAPVIGRLLTAAAFDER
jgi:hypothetical protein